MVYFFLLDRTRVSDLEMRCLNLFKHNTWMGWRCLNCASSLKSLSTPSKARGQRPTQAALLKDIYSLESTKMFLKRGQFLHNAMSSPVISCPVSPITSFGVWSLRRHLRQSTLCWVRGRRWQYRPSIQCLASRIFCLSEIRSPAVAIKEKTMESGSLSLSLSNQVTSPFPRKVIERDTLKAVLGFMKRHH